MKIIRTQGRSIKKTCFIFLLIFLNQQAIAGFNGLTIHSRANCGNNESITWDWTHNWTLYTISDHFILKKTKDTSEIIKMHTIKTGWETTWRSAAVHWGEGRGNWHVSGEHLIRKDNNRDEILGIEEVTDCSIYDGWWDNDKGNEMNYKTTAAALLAAPMIAHAGVQVVSLASMGITNEQAQKSNEIQQEVEKKGYHETNDDRYINFLLNRKKSARDEINTFSLANNTTDTHLKKSSSDIPLAFKYNTIPVKQISGFAPIGTYIKDKGWTGIKVFFTDPNLGSCAYSQMNNELTHGGVTLARESIKHYINSKPAYPMVYGNNNAGFIYTVDWYGKNDFFTLDCANKNFNPKAEAGLLKMAEKIDNHQV